MGVSLLDTATGHRWADFQMAVEPDARALATDASVICPLDERARPVCPRQGRVPQRNCPASRSFSARGSAPVRASSANPRARPQQQSASERRWDYTHVRSNHTNCRSSEPEMLISSLARSNDFQPEMLVSGLGLEERVSLASYSTSEASDATRRVGMRHGTPQTAWARPAVQQPTEVKVPQLQARPLQLHVRATRQRRASATRASVPSTRASSRRRPADRCKFPGKCHVPDTSESTCQGSRQADKYTEKCHVPDTSDHAFSPRLVPLRVAVSVRRKHRIVAEETVTEAASIDASDLK